MSGDQVPVGAVTLRLEFGERNEAQCSRIHAVALSARLARAVVEALSEVERQATHPTGWRKVIRGTITALANTLPEVSLVATIGYLLWNFFIHNQVPDLFRVSLVVLIPLLVVIVFQMLIVLLLPVRWPVIRSDFRRQLGDRMAAELTRAYLAIPEEVAAAIRGERAQVEEVIADAKQVADWLTERQHAARVGELYGK